MDTQTHATIDDLYKVEGKAELVHGEIIEMLPAEDEPSSAGGDIIVSLHASARHIRHGNTSPDGIGRTGIMRGLIICWLTLSLSVAQAAKIGQQTTGACRPTIVHHRGRIVITCATALPDELSQQYQQLIETLDTRPDQQQQIATELEVTASALRHFVRTVQQQAVPLAELDSTLREIAGHYQELQTRLRTLRGNDPEVTQHKNDAQRALEAGAYDRAEALLNAASARAIELGEKRRAVRTQQLLAAAQAKAANGDLQNSQLMYAAAAAYYGEAAALLTTINTPLPRAAYLNQEGLAWLKAGQYSKAQPPLEQARILREQTLGPAHPDVATSLNNLAGFYRSQGQYAQAAPLYARVLALREKALGPEHPDVATSLNNLAGLYNTQGQYAQASPLYARALAIREQVLHPEHPDVATSLNNLAGLYDAQGQYAQAAPLYRRALAIREKVLGPAHPDIAQSLNNLAGLYHTRGQYAQATSLSERALAIREQVLHPEHPDVATSLNNLAGLYWAQGQYAQAAPLYARALAICEQVLGAAHPDVATVVRHYTALLQTLDRHDDAARILMRWQAAQAPRAWLGIHPRPSTNPPGILVEQVIAGSPATQAGLQPQDVIVRVNAHAVHDARTFHRSVRRLAPGVTVDLEVIHNGQRRMVPVTLGIRPLPTP